MIPADAASEALHAAASDLRFMGNGGYLCAHDTLLAHADALDAARATLEERERIVELAQRVVDSGAWGGHYLGVNDRHFHALKDALAALGAPETSHVPSR